jgi:anti-sigma regulatory factor (Ser/Thr protein kinase)
MEAGSKRASSNQWQLSPQFGVAVGVIALVIITTWALRVLEHYTAGRPYTIFYLVPIALAAAFVSQRFAYVASLVAVTLAGFFLFSHDYYLPNTVELIALIFGTTAIATVVGRLQSVLLQLDTAKDSLIHSEEQRVLFNRDVLLAVTGGRMRLCDDAEIATQIHGEPAFSITLATAGDATLLRRELKDMVAKSGLAGLRLSDLETAVTEAATNAIKHGNGGAADVWYYADAVTVLIRDRGTGISPTDLARATLERGYSSRYSLGMGFTMILESVDSMSLSTSSAGTQILIRVGSMERRSPEQGLLVRYSPAEV